MSATLVIPYLKPLEMVNKLVLEGSVSCISANDRRKTYIILKQMKLKFITKKLDILNSEQLFCFDRYMSFGRLTGLIKRRRLIAKEVEEVFKNASGHKEFLAIKNIFENRMTFREIKRRLISQFGQNDIDCTPWQYCYVHKFIKQIVLVPRLALIKKTPEDIIFRFI